MYNSHVDFVPKTILKTPEKDSNSKLHEELFHLSNKKNLFSSEKKSEKNNELDQINKEFEILEKQKQIEQTSFLAKYHSNFLLILFDYFDPISLSQISQTCKYFNEICNHSNLYKKFCLILFPSKFVLPQESPYLLLKEYILANQIEFQQQTLNLALKDIRELVWGPDYNEIYRTNGQFYKQFKNWKNCFLQAPKINLKGYYLLKEKYIKYGERDFNQIYDPIHIVEYYRYIRFLDTGKCIMAITVSKLNQEKVIKIFKRNLEINNAEIEQNFEEGIKKKHILKATVLQGEYIKKEGKVFIKFCQKGSSVFEYELFIKSSEFGKNDLLILEKKINRELTNNYSKNDNDIRAESVKIFQFKYVKEFGDDIKNSKIKSVSL